MGAAYRAIEQGIGRSPPDWPDPLRFPSWRIGLRLDEAGSAVTPFGASARSSLLPTATPPTGTRSTPSAPSRPVSSVRPVVLGAAGVAGADAARRGLEPGALAPVPETHAEPRVEPGTMHRLQGWNALPVMRS